MRIDLFLHRARFAKSRSIAQGLVEKGIIRCNSGRVLRSSHAVKTGDVLTLMVHGKVQIVEILALPERRGPAQEAQQCYLVLDQSHESALAEDQTALEKGTLPQ